MCDLYAAATRARVRRLVRFPDGMHNDTWNQPEYFEEIIRFFELPAARV
jgi:hypothetical protein